MLRFSTKVTLAVAALAALDGCSGGGSSAPPSSNATRITAGIAVDPIRDRRGAPGARADRRVVQVSTASDEHGAFTFAAPLTRGNLVTIAVKGLHNGEPYDVRLARQVDIADGVLVVSPLTTLLAGGRTPAEVVGLLNGALGATLTARELTLDPMAPGRPTAASSRPRWRSARRSRSSTGTSRAASSRRSSARWRRRSRRRSARGSLTAVSSAAAAVAAYVARHATDAASAEAAAAQVDSALIAQLVAAAGSGQPVALDEGLAVAVTPGTVASHVEKGMAALEAALASTTVPTAAFLDAVRSSRPPTPSSRSTRRRSRRTRTRPTSSVASPAWRSSCSRTPTRRTTG